MDFVSIRNINKIGFQQIFNFVGKLFHYKSFIIEFGLIMYHVWKLHKQIPNHYYACFKKAEKLDQTIVKPEDTLFTSLATCYLGL